MNRPLYSSSWPVLPIRRDKCTRIKPLSPYEDAQLSVEDDARLAYSDQGAYYTVSDKSDGGAAVFYSGYVTVGEEERNKVACVLQTQELMMDIQQAHPLIAAIYLNTFDSLNVIYPYFDVISQYTMHMDIPSYNFYYEADETHNPERTVQWTDVYLDPAGQGWMASCIAPVYDGDFLEGVVGIDITVSTVTEQVLNMNIPWDGYGILVGEDGTTILALPEKGEEEWGLSELTDHSYSEAIMQDTFKPEQFNLYNREDLTLFAQALKDSDTGIDSITLMDEIKVVSWDTVPETGWKLILIVPESNIYASLDDMSTQLDRIGGIMIAGFILFGAVFFTIVYWRARKMSLNISQPLIELNGMVKSIGEGNYHQNAEKYTVKELDETARNIVNMGNMLGEANQELLDTQLALKDNEAYLQILVDSLDDVILEVDDSGRVYNVRAKDISNLAVGYFERDNHRIQNIMSEKSAAKYLDVVRRVLITGKTEAIEYQIETPKGRRWYQARVSMINAGAGRVVVSARDITDRIVMEQSIRVAKDEAERASQSKSQFLSNMSHELRTPLNAVLGFAQLMELDPSEPLSATQKEYVEEIEKAGKHLLELINEVLDLAKVESGKATISLESVSVNDVVEETLAMIRPIAEKKGVAVICPVCECRQLSVKADFIRLKQVLINLLSNAVKYNRENGKIDYFCEKVDNNLRFHVIDTGFGIPQEELGKIFEPFHRVGGQVVEGTGIGLAMVKQLMEMMGGCVFVESQLDEGSHFYVELPLAEMRDLQQDVVPVDAATIRKMRNKEMYTVMYVEDNPANLSLVKHILRAYPFIELVSAVDGESGLALAKQMKLDLVILDINLPDMDGYELYKALRDLHGLSGVPILALSANAMDKDIKKALEIGFDDYLTKPIDVACFSEKLIKALFTVTP